MLDWTGGQSVELNITSLNLIDDSIPYTITCPILSSSCEVPGSVLWTVELPSLLNGVACLLSTQYDTQFYLNLQPTYVNIVRSPEVIQEVVNQINPASLVDALNKKINLQFKNYP